MRASEAGSQNPRSEDCPDPDGGGSTEELPSAYYSFARWTYRIIVILGHVSLLSPWVMPPDARTYVTPRSTGMRYCAPFDLVSREVNLVPP